MALKIGILTLPIAENYGGILQAISLYRTLHNHGHEVVLIYKEIYPTLWKKIARKILLKIPFQNFKNIKTNNKISKLKLERKKFHRPFIENMIPRISENLYTKHDLENFIKKEFFDVVIVGSDQVWRKQYINDKYYKSYFLDFVDGKRTKKIAYAASFGKDYWEGKNDIKDISNLLQDFTAISMREKSGIDICSSIFGYKNAKHVLDPTMLMSKEFYINEIISKYNVSRVQKGGLLTYVLDEEDEKKDIINFVKKSIHLERIHHLKGFNNSNITYSVPEWLASFLNADFVVTDSFHGMVFSIIFEKDFIVIGNKKRGIERFFSLLTLFGLEDRLVFSIQDVYKKDINTIDYPKLNQFLAKEILESEEFLLNNINF